MRASRPGRGGGFLAIQQDQDTIARRGIGRPPPSLSLEDCISIDLVPRVQSGCGAVDISVVIPAYYGAHTIADCLESVERATRGRDREIIVVESSGDATAEIVRQRFPGVVLIRSAERLSAGGARNRGAAEAHGRLVFFTDQDCIVPADWVDQLERHLEEPTVGAAGGAVGIRYLSNLSGCAVYFLEFLNHFPANRPPRRNENFLVGCNSAYRAQTLQIVHFPDQTIGEDVLLSHELRSNGFGVVYDPRSEVRHHNREGWGEFFNYNRKMGRSSAAYHQVLQRWWAVPFLRIPALAFLAPVVILPSIALDLARSRWSYFFRFVLLSPMCLLGNLVWASAFRRQVLETRAQLRINDPA
jgi:GT2 family glycosyltransferase